MNNSRNTIVNAGDTAVAQAVETGRNTTVTVQGGHRTTSISVFRQNNNENINPSNNENQHNNQVRQVHMVSFFACYSEQTDTNSLQD